jgi:hypothetical protein
MLHVFFRLLFSLLRLLVPFLGKSLELLSTADIAYFAKGWENARGCRIENTCAIEYGIAVIEDYTED